MWLKLHKNENFNFWFLRKKCDMLKIECLKAIQDEQWLCEVVSKGMVSITRQFRISQTLGVFFRCVP